MPSTITSILASFLAAFGLANMPEASYQGYVEADYILVAPQTGGTLEALNVRKGESVEKDLPLFTLERQSQKIALDRARAEVREKQATLEDLTKAKREPEIKALFAQRDQASAALDLAKANWERDKKLISIKAISQADADRSRAAFEGAQAKLQGSEAALATGHQSIGRNDVIRAAEAALSVAENNEATAQWSLDQKQVSAPAQGLVFDTFYEIGEFIPAGQAVVSLLPPENIKVRFFVPAPSVEDIKIGQSVSLVTTQRQEIPAKVTYISTTAEYAPPQLFNRDNREKLLYLIEARPDNFNPALHPGQPLDVLIVADRRHG